PAGRHRERVLGGRSGTPVRRAGEGRVASRRPRERDGEGAKPVGQGSVGPGQSCRTGGGLEVPTRTTSPKTLGLLPHPAGTRPGRRSVNGCACLRRQGWRRSPSPRAISGRRGYRSLLAG